MHNGDTTIAGADGSAEADPTMAGLRARLTELQHSQIAHAKRAIILFEGPQGAGKKFALKQLIGALDPCHFVVHSTPNDRRDGSEGHWLARYWRQLPAAGNSAIFFHGWYRRVIEDRVLGRTDEKSISRRFDEINEFEAQQRDYGTLLVKLYFDVSADVQDQRMARRRLGKWHSAGDDDEYIRADNPAYQHALKDLRSNTDTRWSPWQTIDADDERQAAIAALEAVVAAWSKAMPAEPQARTSSSG